MSHHTGWTGGRSHRLALVPLLALALAGVVLPAPAAAQRGMSRAAMERNEYGLGVGLWHLDGVQDPSGATVSQWPFFDFYLQHGVETHSAVETGIGLYRRVVASTTGQGLYGPDTPYRFTTYMIPFTLGVRMFPLTSPDAVVEPFGGFGVGFVLALDQRKGTGPLGGNGGTTLITGLGLKAGAGLELHIGPTMGLTLGEEYQWNRFGAALGPAQTYRGFRSEVGLVYRPGSGY
jgi:opacity protein-like surface antigen